jgi:tetratricopeptide (TPR) repeat protein
MKRLLLAAALWLGCAHQPPKQTRIDMEPMTFQAKPSGEVELVDAASSFEKAGAAFQDKRHDEAAARFDELVQKFPDSRFVTPSLYNAGLAYEAKGDFRAAAERYKALIARKVGGNDELDAEYRLAAVYGALENWPAAAEVFSRVLEKKDLTMSDRLEAMARRGVAQFNMKDVGAAERTLRDTLLLARRHETDERLDTDFFVGMSAYYIGEIAHLQYRQLPVRMPEKQLAVDLEAKARMLLVAQNRYYDTIRVKNPDWATAAGFQIASLYREFYDDLVGAPLPPGLTGEAREVYLEELKKKVSTLLQKAVKVHELNLTMAERTGTANEWVKKSNEQMDQLRKLLVPGTPTPPNTPATTPPPTVAPPQVPGRRDDFRPHPIL